MKVLRALRIALSMLCCISVHAQVVPGSGELLQQTPRTAQPPPSSDPSLVIRSPAPGPRDQSAFFVVQHFVITGNTLISSTELQALVSSSKGMLLNLSYLEDLAALITKRYQDRGFLLSRAYIPPQTLSDGTAHIAILEARYGKVTLTNRSNVSDALLKSYIAPMQTGAAVAEAGLERSLLLLSDVPGTSINSTLMPGAATGTSDLEVDATSGARYNGNVSVDNAGNRYTGRVRGSGTLNFNDPLRQGDVLSATVMTAGSGLTYGRLAYQALIDNGAGTSVGGAVSGLYYHLGNGLSELHAHGTAQDDTLSVNQALIRSTTGNLFLQVAVDNKELRDEIDTTDIHTDRRMDGLTLTLAGDRRNASGIFNVDVGVSVGDLRFKNHTAESVDAAGARIRGSFAKLTASLARLQGLTDSDSLYVAINGQIADKNLDPSEQFFLGGPNSVRAYDVGTVGGADGALATVELRHTLHLVAPGVWQAVAFVDNGYVRVFQKTFEEGLNHATLSGVGAGLNWTANSGWTATVGLARPVGGRSELTGDASSFRGWLEIRKAFSGRP